MKKNNNAKNSLQPTVSPRVVSTHGDDRSFQPTAMIDHFSQMRKIADKEDINYLVLDKDDTLVPVYHFEVTDKKIQKTLSNFHNMGKFVIIVSNSVSKD